MVTVSSAKCYMDDFDGTYLFIDDATWIQQPGLADAGGVSFESFNYPGFYLRHKQFRLRID